MPTRETRKVLADAFAQLTPETDFETTDPREVKTRLLVELESDCPA